MIRKLEPTYGDLEFNDRRRGVTNPNRRFQSAIYEFGFFERCRLDGG